MLVYTNTDEADVGRIRVGAQANFRVDTFPRETFYGHVDQVRMNATTIQNVVTYNTTIAFDNLDLRLFPGMTAYVSIPVATANNVVKIPNGALRFKPDLTDSERKTLYAKYNINDNARGTAVGRVAAGGSAPAGDAGQGAIATAAAPAGAGDTSAWQRQAHKPKLAERAAKAVQETAEARAAAEMVQEAVAARMAAAAGERAQTASARTLALSGSCFPTRLSSQSRWDSA